jgi:hypothetical protein
MGSPTCKTRYVCTALLTVCCSKHWRWSRIHGVCAGETRCVGCVSRCAAGTVRHAIHRRFRIRSAAIVSPVGVSCSRAMKGIDIVCLTGDSACVKYAPVNARCRLFATVLGDTDPDALLGPVVDMLTSSPGASTVLAENRRMAMDFLLHILGFTLDIDASVSCCVLRLCTWLAGSWERDCQRQIKVARARDLGLVKRLGPGVPGSGSTSDRCKVSKGCSVYGNFLHIPCEVIDSLAFPECFQPRCHPWR